MARHERTRIARAAGSVAAGVAAIAAGTAVVVAAGVAGGVALGAARRDESVDRRWAQVRLHRYAHRGLHDKALGIPENSMAAFMRARERGFGVELDVHLTADGGLVVVHDSDLARMCGEGAGVVEELTATQACALCLDGTSQTIPTLDEVLSVFEWDSASEDPIPAPMIVELKTRDGNAFALAEAATRAMDAHNVRYVVESFDPRVLLWYRTHRPDVIRGQLAENFLLDGATSDYAAPVRAGMTALAGDAIGRPDFIAYKFADRDNPFVRAATGPLGAKLVTWTIRNANDMLASESEGAPVIFEGFVPGPRSTIAPGTNM